MPEVKFTGAPIKIRGKFPQIGDIAPAFELVGKDLSPVSLSDYKGKKIVLNIFPSLDTSVCATSVRKFNVEAAKKNRCSDISYFQRFAFCSRPFLYHGRN